MSGMEEEEVLAIDQLGFILLSEEVCSDLTHTDTSAIPSFLLSPVDEVPENFEDQRLTWKEAESSPRKEIPVDFQPRTKDPSQLSRHHCAHIWEMASNAQKLSAAAEFINDAPPGEMAEVLAGIPPS